MAEKARLIPSSGADGAEEQERRASSALLAVMTAARAYGRGLTKPFGAPAGTVETHIEVPWSSVMVRLFPDGLIRVSRADDLDGTGRGQDGQRWACCPSSGGTTSTSLASTGTGGVVDRSSTRCRTRSTCLSDGVAANLKAWSAKPPKLRSEAEVGLESGVALALASTAISSQDAG